MTKPHSMPPAPLADRPRCGPLTRAFRASALLLEQLAYPEPDAKGHQAYDASLAELSMAVTLMSGALLDCGVAPGIG
jgi:hypothetical protein